MFRRLLCHIRSHKWYPVGTINGHKVFACGRCGKTIVNG